MNYRLHKINYKARRLSVDTVGTEKLYIRFLNNKQNGCYNITELFGLETIDIDEPQSIRVSIRLSFIVGEGEDTVEQIV
jgi:hypothetical protein